ncbi:hypothetical protein STAFG_2829 [Streptomyces afghaniensis 772]|uniref:Uncharacterized protein n=1 Tax=Streptomyces afghaniensis 772 TaxID=1283301 RepID=S4MW97_9ACTN|nr:hypothetical protein STAFG_2829 [Streptomyces afghaniensis 772]
MTAAAAMFCSRWERGPVPWMARATGHVARDLEHLAGRL